MAPPLDAWKCTFDNLYFSSKMSEVSTKQTPNLVQFPPPCTSLSGGCQGCCVSEPTDKLAGLAYTGPVGNFPCYWEPKKVKVSDIIETEPKWDLEAVYDSCAH